LQRAARATGVSLCRGQQHLGCTDVAFQRIRGIGRLIMRQIWTRRELNLALKDERCDVAQVFVLERRGTGNGKAVYESVCGLTSLPPALASPAQLLAYVQHRWHIENRCHW